VFIRLLVTLVKHWRRAVAILAMFCCVFGAMAPPVLVPVVADTSPEKSRIMSAGGAEDSSAHADIKQIEPSNPYRAEASPMLYGSCIFGSDTPKQEYSASPVAVPERVQDHSANEHAKAVGFTATELTQPPPFVERTQPITVSYSLTYTNGSSVKTAPNAVVSVQKSQLVSTIPLLLNKTSGSWIATWASQYSANLTNYSFVLDPSQLNDGYGNTGIGSPLVSFSFSLIPAKITLGIQGLSTLSRRQLETITIPAVYHDGSPLVNATLKATLVDANGTSSPVNMTINGVLATKDIDLPADAHLGLWQFNANFIDNYGNKGEGTLAFEVVRAQIKFSLTLPQPVERTTTINVTTAITYPDGQPLNFGVNGNISIGTMSQSLNLQYVPANQTWNGLYHVSQNATLGAYNLTINAGDSNDNRGRYTTDIAVVPANFAFSVPAQKIQVPPVNLTDIVVSVTYPNGTAMGDNVGTVTATYDSPSGGITTMLLQYNATDTKWHILFYTPDQRFKLYAITLVFAFEAHDIFGNNGSETDALEMTVTTPINLLVLAAIIGVIVPASLLVWAMLTVTKKRRKHKP